jgi:RHS repeat-associated protein
MYWHHYNNKGDVVGLTKQNGNSHHNYRYDPYGAVLPENGNFTDPHNHYTLTGKEFDENTGLVWFGARHYEPETGVWMGQDSYRGRLSEPGTLHRFGYVGNNPVSYWDWYGFWKMAAKNGQLVAISESGDNLWTLAEKLTGDGNNYKLIAKENGIPEKEAGSIRIGQEFKIPGMNNDMLEFINDKLSFQYKQENTPECYEKNAQGNNVYSNECNQSPENCWGTAAYLADLIPEYKYLGLGGDVTEKYNYNKNPDDVLKNKGFTNRTDDPEFGDIGRYAYEIGYLIPYTTPEGKEKKFKVNKESCSYVGVYSEGIRSEDESDCLTHYVTFLIESKDGDRFVFSKSGSQGVYEVGIDDELGYGTPTGYYSYTEE